MPISSPTAFDVKCKCGREYHTSDEHVGKYVNCECGRRVPIQHPDAIERHSPIDDPGPSPPEMPKAPSPVATGASKLETLSRFAICVSAFLAFALLLSKLLLLAARNWSMYLPSRRFFHANLNAALLVAVGFAAASGLILLFLRYRPGLHDRARQPLWSGRSVFRKGKSGWQRIMRHWKLILTLGLCSVLAGVAFWVYRSR